MSGGTRIALLLATCAIVACSATPEKGRVQREWVNTLRELGINPVFPPREDLQVGDVYLRRGDPEDPATVSKRGFVPLDLWLASLNEQCVIVNHYARRPSFPDTNQHTGEPDAGKAVVQIPEQDDLGVPDRNTFMRRDLGQLRQVAFPDFTSFNIRAADLRALVPVEALSIGLGASFQNEHEVSVKIPAAESYGVPFSAIRPYLTGPDGRVSSRILSTADLPMLRSRQREVASYGTSGPTGGSFDPDYIWIDVITEVFYARELDISIQRREASGVRVRVTKTVTTTAATGETSTETTEYDEPDSSLVAGETAVDRADAMNKKLREVDSLKGTGGSLTFLAVTHSGVAMKRIFERPVAVGWRGVTLKVRARSAGLTPCDELRLQDGAVVGLGAAAGGQPNAGTTAANAEVASAERDANDVLEQSLRSFLPDGDKYRIRISGGLPAGSSPLIIALSRFDDEALPDSVLTKAQKSVSAAVDDAESKTKQPQKASDIAQFRRSQVLANPSTARVVRAP